MSGAKHRYSDLDGMRGVLSVAVMLFHYGLNTVISRLTGGILTGGEWGLCVDFFFILSGFVLSASFSKGVPSLAVYAQKRFRRLAPVYLLTIIWLSLLPGFHLEVPVAVANLLMIQSLLGMGSINFPAWSIPFELAVPAAALISYGVLVRWPLVILCCVMVFGSVTSVLLASGHDIQWLRASAGIVSGFCLFAVKGRMPTDGSPAISVTMFAACIGIMLVARQLPIAAALFLPCAAAAVVFGAGATTWLSSAPFQALGRWSYGIYLTHIPVLMTTTWLLGEARVDGDAIFKGGMVAATIAIAALLHTFVEQPALRFRAAALN